MGLDMYLERMPRYKNLKADDIANIESVGYWRKANAIHKWFVDNVQNGEDDCGYYEATKEQLTELLDICIEIRDSSRMEETAQELLPTQCGFFFGSTEYDEYYIDDIIDTISILTKVLKETDFDNQMVVYTSSW